MLQSRREKQPASVGVDGVDKDATFAHRNEEEEFLSLDDINGTNKSNMDMRKNNSSNVVDIVPLTPMGLVPPEEAEKKDNPLYSRKGEILASCKDFRVNTYTPHANGAFVLDLAGISPTREFLREGNNRNASVLDVGPGDENGNLQAGTSNNEALLPILNFSDLGGAGDNDCDDNDAGDAFPPLAEGNDMEVDPSPSEHVERRQAVNDRHMLRERALAPAETEKPKEFLDPWRSLDPFSNSEDKPFKKDYEGADVKGKKKVPTFADMEVLYWKNMKERLVAQKKIQKKMGILFSNEIAEHQNKDLENAEEQNEVEDNRHDDYLDNDGGDDFSDHENLAQDFPAEILDEEGLAATEPQEERPSYEDLVRRNVEERVAFDIHDYGDKIVDAFSQVGERRTFASIVKGKEAFEANDCTVKIDKKPGLYESIDSMELTLLSKRRAHERFQTYAAPSLTDF
ncbi:Condensin-2 complex subunit H2 [Acipenser ruthenus]|uniref:Condensin-2 complex subunit H2 n=1 Tax=Acipenser ruthenus TaxID=7906 RepID=A0A444U6L2_ACIRT|nr:Condensin-2 complex subunit H2 [Acipenser ruthenus]